MRTKHLKHPHQWHNLVGEKVHGVICEITSSSPHLNVYKQNAAGHPSCRVVIP